MGSVIFDLDQTIIDSTISIPFRGRNWAKTYELIPHYKLYDGIRDTFKFIRDNGLKIAVVSTSPSTYCNRVLNHWRIPYDFIVGYHDAKPIKPHPAPMQRALDLLQMGSAQVISFGDRVIDIQSSLAANIKAVACLWGSTEDLSACAANYIISKPIDSIAIIEKEILSKS